MIYCIKDKGPSQSRILQHEDNKTAIITAENECSAEGHMKNVDVKFRRVQKSIKLGEIRVRYISTELNWADVLTKALVPKKHKDTLEAIIGDPRSAGASCCLARLTICS